MLTWKTKRYIHKVSVCGVFVVCVVYVWFACVCVYVCCGCLCFCQNSFKISICVGDPLRLYSKIIYWWSYRWIWSFEISQVVIACPFGWPCQLSVLPFIFLSCFPVRFDFWTEWPRMKLSVLKTYALLSIPLVDYTISNIQVVTQSMTACFFYARPSGQKAGWCVRTEGNMVSVWINVKNWCIAIRRRKAPFNSKSPLHFQRAQSSKEDSSEKAA